MKSVYAAAFTLLLAAAPALAQTASDPSGFGGLSTQAGEQVSITADALEIVEDENTALFTGNVLIIQGTMEMRAPQVLAVYGEGGPGDLENFTASGGRVHMVFDDQTTESDEAFYDFSSRTLTLTGNVVVVNASGTVESARLVIDTRAGTSSFSGGAGGGGRVTGVFTPGGG
ncbi:LptA/OstA family protein [Pelagibacterium limicola]|uniref:LptA/OstA family protein n=1 Tax=Pelagibacterium limicola TaxID=2791022 RepID=UPI0018AF5DA0|nr:LptA/OstA family protein [Pelagibacterium limicola]